MPIAPTNWQVLRDHISEHLTTCAICGGNDWDIQEPFIWQIGQHKPGIAAMIGPGIVNPAEQTLLLASLTCRDCKYVVFFNANAILARHMKKGKNQ